MPLLTNPEKLELFDTLVYLASSGHGAIGRVREILLSLPRDWVLTRIEDAAEPYLRDGTYDEYRRFLELYERLDRRLMLKLAQRAAAHSDPDIQEAGQDYLESSEHNGVPTPFSTPVLEPALAVA